MKRKSVVNWNIEDEIANECKISQNKVTKVISLINEGSSIPFIARYRKETTENLTASDLIKVKDSMKEYENVINMVEKKIKSISKMGLLNEDIKKSLENCKTIEDVEFVSEPFKAQSQTFLSRAKQCDLDKLADKIMTSKDSFNVRNSITESMIKEFKEIEQVEEVLLKLIANKLAKDFSIIQEIEKGNLTSSTKLKCNLKQKYANKTDDEEIAKLKNYYDFYRPVDKIFAHQILAINRGESKKFLDVKLELDHNLRDRFIDLCKKEYLSSVFKRGDNNRIDLLKCAKDAYDRLVMSYLVRKIRNKLTKDAHEASLKVFESNLRRLVMSRPLYGATVLGIDPGVVQGCKMAVYSDRLLDSDVMYLDSSPDQYTIARNTLIKFVTTHRVEYVAIGDGINRGAPVKLICELIRQRAFGSLNVKYCIVRESGVSIYSVTPEADLEFSDLDPKIRSAIYIARRLQDPLGEYVKIDPKNLGLGMYQHDLKTKELNNRIENVLDECISFVGVDINHAPLHIIKHISGLGPAKASAIINYRETNGPFKNRNQLMQVKGIKEGIFKQIAGFIRVTSCGSQNLEEQKENVPITIEGDVPRRSRKKKKSESLEMNPLDQTSIHPESYGVAERIIKSLQFELSDIGSEGLRRSAKLLRNQIQYRSLLDQFLVKGGTYGYETLDDIVTSLTQPLEFDIRTNFQTNLLRQNCYALSDLHINMRVEGTVQNVTTFGSFIDIGYDSDALCHRNCDKFMCELGDAVLCNITSIKPNKISVAILRKL